MKKYARLPSATLVVASLLVPLAALCAEEEQTTYSNVHHGFSIAYPKAFTFVDRFNAGDYGTVNWDAEGHDGISFVARGIPKGVDLRLFERSMLDRGDGNRIVDLKSGVPAKLGSLTAHRFDYTQTWNDETIKVCVVTAVTAERGYLFTLSAPGKEFSKYETVFKKLCGSFKTFPPDAKNSVLGDPTNGYSIEYPVTWTFNVRTSTVTLSPLILNANESLNMGIIIGCETREGATTKSLATQMLADLRRNNTYPKLSEPVEVTIGKTKALRFSFADEKSMSDTYTFPCEKGVVYMVVFGPIAAKATLDAIVNSATVEPAKK